VILPLLLEVPVRAGLEPITLTRYPVPPAAPAGIVAAITPDPVPESVPIVVGEAKDPAASDNWAVKVFPPAKAPHTVKGTFTFAPLQSGVLTGCVVMVCGFTVRFVPLSDPVMAGLEPTTRIRYPVPVAAPGGMIAAIVPELTAESVPIVVGEAKEPAASDN